MPAFAPTASAICARVHCRKGQLASELAVESQPTLQRLLLRLCVPSQVPTSSACTEKWRADPGVTAWSMNTAGAHAGGPERPAQHRR